MNITRQLQVIFRLLVFNLELNSSQVLVQVPVFMQSFKLAEGQQLKCFHLLMGGDLCLMIEHLHWYWRAPQSTAEGRNNLTTLENN